MAHKPVICIVGGIGSGKSVVAVALARHGGHVINGDRLGHEALEQTDIRRRVVEHWGPNIVKENGAIDRRKLAGIVFAESGELRALEQLVFPWIKRRIGEEIA